MNKASFLEIIDEAAIDMSLESIKRATGRSTIIIFIDNWKTSIGNVSFNGPIKSKVWRSTPDSENIPIMITGPNQRDEYLSILSNLFYTWKGIKGFNEPVGDLTFSELIASTLKAKSIEVGVDEYPSCNVDKISLRTDVLDFKMNLSNPSENNLLLAIGNDELSAILKKVNRSNSYGKKRK